MMTDREKALAYFRHREAQIPMPGARAMYQEAIKALEQPTIEPERKKGEWINSYKRQTCSVCKQRGYRSWSFCPNCGADMRER